MAIHFDAANQLFHLQTKSMSYIFQSLHGYPAHLYWGRKLNEANPDRLLARVERLPSAPIR